MAATTPATPRSTAINSSTPSCLDVLILKEGFPFVHLSYTPGQEHDFRVSNTVQGHGLLYIHIKNWSDWLQFQHALVQDQLPFYFYKHVCLEALPVSMPEQVFVSQQLHHVCAHVLGPLGVRVRAWYAWDHSIPWLQKILQQMVPGSHLFLGTLHQQNLVHSALQAPPHVSLHWSPEEEIRPWTQEVTLLTEQKEVRLTFVIDVLSYVSWAQIEHFLLLPTVPVGHLILWIDTIYDRSAWRLESQRKRFYMEHSEHSLQQHMKAAGYTLLYYETQRKSHRFLAVYQKRTLS